MFGCLRRVSRLFDPTSGRTLILPLDRGLSDGSAAGLDDVGALLAGIKNLPVQAVLFNKGSARTWLGEVSPFVGAAVQLSGGTRHGLPSYAQTLVCSVAEAQRLGADLVAVRVNIGNDLEDRMLSDFGLVADEAHAMGLPVLALIRPKGGQIVNELDSTLVAHCIRLGAEMAADLIGVPYSGDPESFERAVRSCQAPVLLTGGPAHADFEGFLKMVREALECGAAGTCIGQEIYTQQDPQAALAALLGVVHTPEKKDEAPAV